MTAIAALSTNEVVQVSPLANRQSEQISPEPVNTESEQTDSPAVNDPIDKITLSGNAKSKEEQQEIAQLKKRDAEVRAHEQAHLSALGGYGSGGPKFTFETGPDGKRYAVGGEVPVDVSKEQTPEETIRKAQAIRRAALAPAQPSGADRGVAAQASQLESQARSELAKERSESASETTGRLSGKDEESSVEGISNETPQVEESTPQISTPKSFQSNPYNATQTLSCANCGVSYNANEGHGHFAKRV